MNLLLWTTHVTRDHYPILGKLKQAGFDVSDVSVAEPTLETVFIQLTGKELRD